MKKINLIEWLSRNSHEKQKPQRFARYAAILIMLLTLGVGQMWATDYYLRYMASMPSGNWDGNTSLKMTQSSSNSNRYYCTLDLTSGTSYGFFIRVDDDKTKCWKADATAGNNKSVQLYSYSGDHGGSPHRVTFAAPATDTYIFTYDVSNNKICVSRKSSETIKISYATASGRDDYYDLGNYTQLSQDGTSFDYYVDLDLTAAKYYMFMQLKVSGSEYSYWRGSSALTEDSSNASLKYYGTSNYGDSKDKINFTPSAAAKYRVIWNHRSKTVKLKRLYNISYQKGDNGTGSTQTDYKVHGTAITLRSSGDFTRTGYNHTAWNTSSTGSGGTSYALGASYTSNANLTLYPTWTAKTTTVTLQANAPAGQTVTGGGTQVTATYDAALPSFSALTCNGGYALTGYWTAPSGGTKVINANGTFNGNSGIWNRTDGATLTLHAQWSLDRTLTYDGNTSTGGSVPASPAVYANNASVTVLGNTNSLVKTGYTFTGWNTAANGSGASYSAGDNITMNANYTLYAQWQENMTTVNLVASPAGGGTFTVGGAAATSTTAGVTTTRSVAAVPYVGYRTAATVWSKSNNYINLSSTTANPITVTGTGTIGNSTNLTATFNRTYAFIEGRFQVYNAARNTLTNTALDNGGWNENQCYIPFSYDGTSHKFYLHTYSTPKELSANIQSNAPVFYIKTSTVSGSLSGVVSSYWSESAQTLSAANTKKTLALNGDVVNYNLKFSSSDESGYAILYFDEAGVWYTLEYTLNYNGNGSTSGSAPSQAYHENGTNATAAANPFAKTNYTFGGWNTTQYITGTNYAAGASVPMNANTTLYAKWTRSITLNQNGGGSGSTSVTASYNCATLPSITNPSKEGYTFGGWNTANDGSGDIVINTSGEFLPITGWCDSQKRFTRTASGATLYAKWTQTVTLNANTANHGSGDNTSATIILNATAKSSITHCTPATGYHLVGYYTAETGGTKVLNADGSFASSSVTDYITSSKWIKAGATTLYAHYEPNTYQVHFNGNGNTGGSMSNETGFTYDEAKALTANAFTKTGYTFAGWATSAGGDKVYNDEAEVTNLTSTNNGTAELYAKWTENNYTVTVEAGEGGSVGSTSVTGHISTLANLPTATPSNGYYFVNWTTTAGTLTNSTSATTGKINGLTSDATVTANFAKIYYLKGSKTEMGSWSTENDMSYAGSANTYSVTLTLAAKTEYEFKIYNRQTSAVYGASSTSFTRASYSKTGLTTEDGSTYNIHITTDAAGDYTFTYVYAVAVGSMQVSVGYPTAYTVTFGSDGHASSVTATASATGTLTSGDYVGNGETVTFAQTPSTGYTLKGWYTTAGGSTSAGLDGSNRLTINGTKTVYAQYNPKTYTITLNQRTDTAGYSAAGSTSLTATYDAAFPSITIPTAATGWAFIGYFSAATGKGTQFTDANGALLANIASYSDASGHWKYDDTKTLYAYYEKSVITSLEHDASIAKGEEVTIDVNPIFNVTPVGYTGICWSLLYADTDNPVEGAHWSVASTSNGEKPDEVRYTLTGLENGSYKIKAIYKSNGSSFDACAAGTEQNTVYSTFRIIGSNTITIKYTNDKYYEPYYLRENGSIEIPAMESVGVKAPQIAGWKFWKWTWSEGISSECGDNTVCNWDKDSINISANYDGTLTAMYQKKRVIYFNNTLGWDTVYVYFYKNNSYWNASNGTGASTTDTYTSTPYSEGKHGGMKRVAPGSNIWYFDAEAAGVNASYTNVAFTSLDQHGYHFFAKTDDVNNKVIRREDYNSNRLPMYVPLVTEPVQMNSNMADYYNEGYWMNYPDSTGYELRIYNKKANAGGGDTDPYELSYKRQLFKFTGDKTMPMAVTVDLEANRTYGFKIYRTDGTYWGNNGTMTTGHSGDEGQTVWEFKTGTSNAGLTTTGAGYYTFTLSYGEDASSNFNYLVGVRYPESSGDFRVMYKDNVKTQWRPSAIIPLATDTTIVSYFVRKNSTPYIKAQKCTISDATLTWKDSISGANLIPLCTGASDTITKYGDGVYNFHFAKVEGNLILAKVTPYTGNFYIRVDGAGYSNWDKYIADDHLMPYSDYSFNQETDKYSHYFCHWYEVPNSSSKKNIKFVVANEYSPYISDTIIQDGIANAYVDGNGDLCRSANVRFMYNYKTNEATRRYVDGAQENGTRFLLLIPSNNTSIYDAATEGNAYTDVTFSDDGNWIYEANVWAVPGTTYKLKSTFGKTASANFDENGVIEQYLKGKASGDGEYETLIAGSGASREHLRLLYDFKTNRLVSAWLPSGTINSDHAINADVMFIREGQEDVTQVTFGNSGSISAIQNVYSVMRFNKWTLNNRDKSSHSLLGFPLSPYERALYWISFPYDVRLSDVFGFGTYGTHWIIEYYDGEYRAAHGYWADSEANWKFVMPNERNNFVLKAGMGYILALDLDKLWCSGEGTGDQDDIWKNIQYGEIIFPGDIASIGNTSVTYNIPAHNCNITRNERNIKDSHWNVIGVPTYLNTDDVTYVDATEKQEWMSDGKPKYIYSWNPQDNSITSISAAGLTYRSMHAYMVQYYGNITFTTSTVSVPAAPRRYENAPRDVEFRLALLNGEQEADNTFVRMSIDDDVTVGFEYGQDLTKEMNASKANIYTLIAGSESNIEVAANVLPFNEQTTVVPVGVKIKTTGDYTFSIPEGTRGVGVTLVDSETGIRTSLSALDYTINLTAGTYDNRFVLEISPIQQTPTGIEAVGDQQSAARKVMIDGLLYIVKDGKVFDARGSRVK